MQDGGLRITVRTDGPAGPAGWCSLGGKATVDEPAGLAGEVADDARAALRRAGIDLPGG